jgi:O-antigen/teichoic acid export membrane protein
MIGEPSGGVQSDRMVEVGWRARLITGITWHLAAVAFTQGSTFAINIVVANILGRQLFGEYAIVRTTVLTLTAVAPLATGYTAARYASMFRSTDRERVGHILGLCTVVSTVAACVAALSLLAGAPWLAADVLHTPRLATGLTLVTSAVLFGVMSAYQVGALAGLESYRALAVAGMIGGMLSMTVCTAAAWTGGLKGALVGLSVSAGLQWLTLRWCLRTELARQSIAIRYVGLTQEAAILMRVAVPAALVGFVSMPTLWLANAFLARHPAGYDQLALYGAANSFRLIVLLMPTVINTVGMSILGHQRGVLDDARYRQVFWTNMGLTVSVVLLGAAAVILFGPRLLMIFGRGFGEGYPVLVVLMLATIPEGLCTAAYQAIHAEEKLWLSLFAIVVPRDGTMAALSYLLSPTYGALGLATAQGTAWVLALSITVFLVRRIGVRAGSSAIAQ